MRTILFKSRFKKDYKKCRSRGLDFDKYKAVMELLVSDATLPDACRAHKLGGEYQSLWECHITPDWLLIYFPDEHNNLILYRMGTHSDLF